MEEAALLQQCDGQVLLYHLSGPLSFGAAKDMTRRLAGFDTHRILALDFSDVPFMDFTSAKVIDDMIQDTRAAGKAVFLSGLQPSVALLLEKAGVVQSVPRRSPASPGAGRHCRRVVICCWLAILNRPSVSKHVV